MLDLLQPDSPLWLTIKVAGLAPLVTLCMGVGAAYVPPVGAFRGGMWW